MLLLQQIIFSESIMIKKEIFGLSVQLQGIQRPCATKSRVRLPLVSYALCPAALHPFRLLAVYNEEEGR